MFSSAAFVLIVVTEQIKKGAHSIEAVNMKDGNDKISKRGSRPPNVIYRYIPGGSDQSIAKGLTVAAWDALVKIMSTYRIRIYTHVWEA